MDKYILTFFNKNSSLFINWISQYYPLSENFLLKYSEFLNWNLVSRNNQIQWDVNIIKKYKENINWEIFVSNNKILWNVEFINQFRDYLNIRGDFQFLSAIAIDWNDDLLKEFMKNIHGASITYNSKIKWNAETLELLINKANWHNWAGQFDYSELSRCEHIPWSVDFILKYDAYQVSDNGKGGNEYMEFLNSNPGAYDDVEVKYRFDWSLLSSNGGLPWSISFINKFISKWNWDNLSKNPSLPWSNELIEYFSSKWNWENLSKNDGILWSEELIKLYAEKLFWNDIVINKSATWSLDLLLKYQNRINFKELSSNIGSFWTKEIILKFKDKWDWTELSRNCGIIWEFELINVVKNLIDFDWLSCNRNVIWTHELLDYFKDKLDWGSLGYNIGFNLTTDSIMRYYNFWDWEKLNRNYNFPYDNNLFLKVLENTTSDFGNLVYAPKAPWTYKIFIENYVAKIKNMKEDEILYLTNRCFYTALPEIAIEEIIKSTTSKIEV